MTSRICGHGHYARRGKGNREAATMTCFKQALDWLLDKARANVAIQRYKGLGEMNAEQLWDATMNPKVRRLLNVQIEGAIAADEIFTALMFEEVEFGCVAQSDGVKAHTP